MSLEEQLQKYVTESVKTTADESVVRGQFKSLNSELRFLRARTKGPNIYFYMMHFYASPPSSVEVENSFSSAGTFACKIRSKLSKKSTLFQDVLSK